MEADQPDVDLPQKFPLEFMVFKRLETLYLCLTLLVILALSLSLQYPARSSSLSFGSLLVAMLVGSSDCKIEKYT